MTQGAPITAPCDVCKRHFSLLDLDSKPSEADLARHGSLQACADAGCDFPRLECRECYGPGYVSLDDKAIAFAGFKP